MFGIGGFELFIILVFGFLIFGPDKLPEIAKTVGRGIARFREAQQEMNDTLGTDKIFDPNNPDEPFKDPVEMLDKIAQKQEEKKNAKAASAKGAGVPAAGAADAAADGQEAAPRQESFTERKARYERERAARKAAEAEAAAKGSAGAAEQSGPVDGSHVEQTSQPSISGVGRSAAGVQVAEAAVEGGDE